MFQRKTIPILILLLLLASTACFAADLTITGKHQIDGVKSGTRTFVMEGAGLTKKTTVNVGKDFSFSFPPGEAEYTVREETLSAEGLLTDPTVYIVRVSKEGVITIENEEGKVNEIVFTDTYEPPSPPSEEGEEEIDASEPPEEPDKPGISKIVKTGDSASYLIWAGLGLAAVIAILAIICRRRKDR